ncbi:hypothetical protein V8C44DRAFT_315329 [Trichoderma aethiopicum]
MAFLSAQFVVFSLSRSLFSFFPFFPFFLFLFPNSHSTPCLSTAAFSLFLLRFARFPLSFFSSQSLPTRSSSPFLAR